LKKSSPEGEKELVKDINIKYIQKTIYYNNKEFFRPFRAKFVLYILQGASPPAILYQPFGPKKVCPKGTKFMYRNFKRDRETHEITRKKKFSVFSRISVYSSYAGLFYSIETY